MNAVSVVVNTNGRAESLDRTLRAMRFLDHDDLEVIVVCGPDDDGMERVRTGHPDVRWLTCPERNLSMSRNIGIGAATAELVAFIDDDAVPDPGWLEPLLAAFSDPEVAATGGPVYDHTGGRLQSLYSTVTRGGLPRIDLEGPNPTDVLGAPESWLVPYPIGTNACFRRSALVACGGFDEEYEYYLDESDVCVRLTDAGHKVALLDDGYVYHGFLPSSVRNHHRAVQDWSPIIKSLLYFATRHGEVAGSPLRAMEDIAEHLRRARNAMELHIAHGLVDEGIREAFERACLVDGETGRRRALERAPRTREAAWFDRRKDRAAFQTLRSRAARLHVCFLSREAPPGPLNGIARVIWDVARGLAAEGHVIRLLTAGDDQPEVEWLEGVWVHRIPVESHDDAGSVPQDLWDYSATMLTELLRIDAQRPVDVVEFPNWDLEGAAVTADGRFTTSMSLVTPLATLLATDPRHDADDPRLRRMLILDRESYSAADGLLASGEAIVREIEDAYALDLSDSPVSVVGHCLHDQFADGAPPPPTARDDCHILFVGRLEPRKGIDVFLEAAAELVAAHDDVVVTIAGDDRQPSPDGRTYPAAFAAAYRGNPGFDRVRFVGRVDDSMLGHLYRDADIVVVPSRYESFGLVTLEAMMHGRPVIASAVGGLAVSTVHGETGLLVPPGDADALREAMERLVAEKDERNAMGVRARERFVARYTIERRVAGANLYYDRLAGRETARVAVSRPAAIDSSPATIEDIGRRIVDTLRCPVCRGELEVWARVVTPADRPKTGGIVCHSCRRVAAAIDEFRIDFHQAGQPVPARASAPPTPHVVPFLGERRISPDDTGCISMAGAWNRADGRLYSEGAAGDRLVLDTVCTDAVVRLLRHPNSGGVSISVNGERVGEFDLFQAVGSTIVPVTVLADAPLGRHVIELTPCAPNPSALGAQIHFDGLVIGGPLEAGFAAPQPVNHGNPWSEALERLVRAVPATDLVLECGGGDRRTAASNRVNFEYLPFELADVYGDIHSLPFADDVFGLVVSQAVFEHVRDPRRAAEELMRVTRPGGVIALEVAFMKPLQAVPPHYYNMTPWGVRELFRECDVLEEDTFGNLSGTVEWLLDAAGIAARAPAAATEAVVSQLRSLDRFATEEGRAAVASGVYLAVRVPS